MKKHDSTYKLILRCMSDGLSRTAYDIIKHTKLGYKTPTRVCELVKKGLLSRVGTIAIPGGRDLAVYKITTEGLLYVQRPRGFWQKMKSLFFIS